MKNVFHLRFKVNDTIRWTKKREYSRLRQCWDGVTERAKDAENYVLPKGKVFPLLIHPSLSGRTRTLHRYRHPKASWPICASTSNKIVLTVDRPNFSHFQSPQYIFNHLGLMSINLVYCTRGIKSLTRHVAWPPFNECIIRSTHIDVLIPFKVHIHGKCYSVYTPEKLAQQLFWNNREGLARVEHVLPVCYQP